jgi:hypothetical protein
MLSVDLWSSGLYPRAESLHGDVVEDPAWANIAFALL